MKELLKKLVNKYLFPAGLAVIFLSVIPYLILGEQSVVPYHDQLDGELIAYLYQAKYLFSGQSVIPEFLCGASKTALLPPAPLAVLLFRVLPPFAALLAMQVIGQVTAYVGMFLLTGFITEKKLIAFVTAMLYAFLPFLPVYGLSQYGMPLLLLCICCLYRGEKVRRSLCYVAFYASMSSLALCGFAWIILWAAALFALAVRKKLGFHKELAAGFLILVSVYVLENLALLGQMLGMGDSTVSHKSEYVLSGGEFLSVFWNYLKYNGEHSGDNHLWIACLAAALLLFVFLFKKRWEEKAVKQGKYLLGTFGFICLLCFVAAAWESASGVSLRKHMGSLGSFQMDRVLWLAPMLWVLVLAFCLDILWSVREKAVWFVYGGSFVLLSCAAVVTLKDSLVKPCIQKLLNPDYGAISYADYLAIGVMEQVEEFIAESEGLQKEEYRVGSLGIDPAAALYHGFYCIDGYSNNYDLEYKHAFRKVIAPELEKSDYLKAYFDDWGNRCYLFSSECPGYYTVEKGGFAYYDLQLDAEALKELGCRYILSAAYVVNAGDSGLFLLNETPFETEDSYYRIFVYRVTD